MAITKPPVLPAWAESGDRVTPSNAEIQVGWPLSSIPPSRQRFNWLLNYLANAVRYFSRRGIPDYDAAETYMIGDRIIGDDGKTYRSLIDTNLAQTPSTSPTKWEEWAPTLARFAALIQGQTYTAFTTAGAAPNFTLTPSPAITAYTAGQRFRVKFHAIGAGTAQLNVSALGNKALKQYDSTGAKVAAVPAANQLADVEYDGVDMVLLDPLPPAVQTSVAIQGSFKNLVVKNNTTKPASKIDVAADEIVLKNASGAPLLATAVTLTADITVNGANGLDTGAAASSTWYYLWAISNGTTTALLISTSSTAPTMPGGYTHKALISAVYRTTSFRNFVQNGNHIQAAELWQTLSGGSSVSIVSVSASAFIPPIHKQITISVTHNTPASVGQSSGAIYSNNSSSKLMGNVNPLSTGSAQGDTNNITFIPEVSQTYYYGVTSGNSIHSIIDFEI